MRIGIDARFNRSPGVERYYNSLIRNLALVDARNEYVVYYPSAQYLERNRVEQENFTSLVLPARSYDLREQFLLAGCMKRDNIDVFHATNSWVTPLRCRPPLVVTVHDMCPKTHPELIRLKARVYAKFMLPYSIRAADRIFTVSEYSKREILSFYPEAEKKIIVAWNGIDPAFRLQRSAGDIERVRKAYGINGEYILFIGALMRHKNVLGLIRAYKLLPGPLKQRYTLVIIGRRVPDHEDYCSEVMRTADGEPVRIIDFAKDDDLPYLYRGATAFVFPSLHEGFGIPLAEAMACGTPVVTSNATAMPEICGDAALYFNPGSVEEIRKGIEKVLVEERLREALSARGRERSRLFSWEDMARKAVECYEDLRGKKG